MSVVCIHTRIYRVMAFARCCAAPMDEVNVAVCYSYATTGQALCRRQSQTLCKTVCFVCMFFPSTQTLLVLLIVNNVNTIRTAPLTAPMSQGKIQDVSLLLGKFKAAQERHVQSRRKAIRKKSLQSDVSTGTAER